MKLHISTLHMSFRYPCVDVVGPRLTKSHFFLVSVSNTLSLSSSVMSLALCAARKTFASKSQSNLTVDLPELQDSAT